MAGADDNIAAEQRAFEREKWLAETGLRERELKLKEQEQHNRSAEVELKREEQKRSLWTNPLTVAVAVAAFAGLSNAVVTWSNGYLQRDLEKQKAQQQRDLEDNKAESE